MKLVAQTLLFFSSLVALAVLYIFLLSSEIKPDKTIDQVMVAIIIVAPFLSSVLLKRKHYAVAALIACMSLAVVVGELSKFLDRL